MFKRKVKQDLVSAAILQPVRPGSYLHEAMRLIAREVADQLAEKAGGATNRQKVPRQSAVLAQLPRRT